MKADPLFAREATAAQLLDMTPGELKQLVEAGHLPAPRDIGGVKRFDVDELRRVIRGDAITGGEMAW